MPYPEFFVEPMRQELTQLGIEELRTPADVDSAVTNGRGTLMIVVNSVCGCAAGKARPGIALALRHGNKPDRIATVFAGADVDATDRARSCFTGYQPSSPSIALFRDGKLSTCWNVATSRTRTHTRLLWLSPRHSTPTVLPQRQSRRNTDITVEPARLD
jgi:putative YphP/YqiW family bacilliredoxin